MAGNVRELENAVGTPYLCQEQNHQIVLPAKIVTQLIQAHLLPSPDRWWHPAEITVEIA
jgi:DNA-binding NtrC family response regulator